MVEITCEEVRRELSNYLDGEVNADLRRRIEDHVARCPGCKAVYDGVRNVIILAGTGEVFALPSGFGQRLRQRLAGGGPN